MGIKLVLVLYLIKETKILKNNNNNNNNNNNWVHYYSGNQGLLVA